MDNILLDVHTHTLVSGHAYSTMTEMVKSASEKGLKILGITEHGPSIPGSCDPFYFLNYPCVEREQFGVKLLLGAEIDILDIKGSLDLEQRFIDMLDIRIAGMHGESYIYGSSEENTNALIKTIENKEIDIISHPDEGLYEIDYKKMIEAAKSNHVLIEINNISLTHVYRKNTKENSLEILNLAKEYNLPIILSSDAHHHLNIKKLDTAFDLIKKANFPKELIINYYPEKFIEFIEYNRKK